MIPSDSTIPDAILAQAERHPAGIAARYLFADGEPVELDFETLVGDASRQAARLASAGLRPGELALIVLPHGTSQLTTLLGALWLGALPALLPYPHQRLDPRRYWENTRQLSQTVRPAALVTTADLADKAGEQLAGAEAARVVAADRASTDVATHHAEPRTRSRTPAPRPATPADAALVQFSSGSTGLQKGAVLSHRAILAEIAGVGEFFSIDSNDRILSWVPLYHDWGLVCVALHGLVCGSGFTLLSPLDWIGRPVAAFEAIDRYGATIYYQPNFAFNLMADRIGDDDMEGLDLTSVRLCCNGAEPCFHDSHERFARRFGPWGLRRESLAIVYGMAEVTNSVVAAGADEPIVVDTIDRVTLAERGVALQVAEDHPNPQRVLGVGRALDGTELRIVGDDRSELPERTVGEVALRSEAAFDGYYHNPEATSAAVDAEGWYYSGDLGYRVGPTLFVTGRKSDLLILAGVNIYPQDIEAIAAEHPTVVAGRVAALGMADEVLGTEKLWIVFESRSDDPSALREISRFLRREVAQRLDVVVHRVVHAPRGWLIKTSSGKIARGRNRRKLPEILTSQQ